MSATVLVPTPTNAFATHVNTSSLLEANNNSTNNNTFNESRFAFLYNFKQDKLSNIRPLNEFFDRNRFRYTTSFPLISERWNYNLQYFSSNYCLIILGLAIYSILTNWSLLFTIGFIFGGFYIISKLGNNGPINIAGIMTLSTTSLYATYACGSVVLLLFSGATGAIFWIIGASALLILGHAAVLEPGVEEGFADDQV